ncbi:MAG: deoxyribonuclease IV [Chitinispirillaceae bacterium]|nr:deoxyribonuclease IV [Chitinispirillaceae bacterium]
MKYIGAHVSTTGGVQNAPLNACAIGATAFAMFTKNQRRWVSKPYEQQTIDAFKKNMTDCGYDASQVLVHDSYLINIGNPNPDKRKQSYESFLDEIIRCSQLGLTLLNIHPGSHLEQVSEQQCIEFIAESINRALDETKGVTVVLENTAGQGSNIGYKFEHLSEIIGLVEDKSRIGVCIDTCHAFAAGYELRTKDAFLDSINKLESIIGIKYLRGLHLNDSKTKLGSKVDRHNSLGKGELGLEPFKFIMQDKRFDNIPLILETIDETLWPEEIRLLQSFC